MIKICKRPRLQDMPSPGHRIVPTNLFAVLQPAGEKLCLPDTAHPVIAVVVQCLLVRDARQRVIFRKGAADAAELIQ